MTYIYINIDQCENVPTLLPLWPGNVTGGEVSVGQFHIGWEEIGGQHIFYWPFPPAGWNTDPYITTYLPGTNIRLTPIAPLIDLHADITSGIL